MRKIPRITPDADTRDKLIGSDGIHFTQQGRHKLAAKVAQTLFAELPGATTEC
jgi:hypothetical protein